MPCFSEKELILCLAEVLAAIIVSIPAAVLIHETGHLLGGLITGYKLIFLMFGPFLFINRSFSETLKKESVHKGAGQCLMYSENRCTRPYLLILGGCIMNFAAFFAVLPLIFSGGIQLMCFFMTFGAVNLSLALSNYFGSSSSCDGRAFRECVISVQDMIAYNNIMMISKYLAEGESLTDIPGWYFGTCSGNHSSALSAEMDFYLYKRKSLIYFRDKTENENGILYSNLAERLQRLKQYDNNTGISEKIAEEELLLGLSESKNQIKNIEYGTEGPDFNGFLGKNN